MTSARTSPGAAPDLATLTGVRSGKRSYYRAYVRTDERLTHTVRAMDSISRALVRTLEGPRGLLEEVVRAAAGHLDAGWAALVLRDGELDGARPRFLALDAGGEVGDDEEALPGDVRREVAAVRAGIEVRSVTGDRWVRVPMTLEGNRIGALVAQHGLADDPEPGDLSVLRILANQAAVSLHTSQQYQAGLALHRRAQRLYDAATAHARDLEERNRQLRLTEERLQVAHQRELVDHERHRIARELHDSVTQYVLSAGMAVEVARGEAEAFGPEAAEVTTRLTTAKALTQEAVDQLRRAIYALHQPQRDTVVSLPELLVEVAAHHRPRLRVSTRVDGEVQPLSVDADHEIARAVGEALFNVATHADATQAEVHLHYRPDLLLVAVSDDGNGEPRDLARRLRAERGPSVDGRHRGLVNIECRLDELGGTLAFRRARLGGVRVEMRVPLPLQAPGGPVHHGVISGLTRTQPVPPPRSPR